MTHREMEDFLRSTSVSAASWREWMVPIALGSCFVVSMAGIVATLLGVGPPVDLLAEV